METREWRGKAIVYGRPVSQGSKRIGRNRDGKPIILDVKDAALKSWRYSLQCAMLETAPPQPLDTAVRVNLTHYVPRPQAHYRASGTLKPKAPQIPPSGLDADKLARGVGDSGTGIFWRDDRRIAEWWVRRLYAEDGRERVEVEAWALE